MASKPTLIFVPGAWFPATAWTKLTTILATAGYKCVPVSLPSSTTGLPTATFLDDVQAVAAAVRDETSAGADVVVICHSYGGMPAQSILMDLDKPAVAAGGRVLGFAMIASGFTMTGMSFLGGLGGVPPPSWRADMETGFAELVADPMALFFHDLSEAEGAEWVGKLGKQSLRALSEGGEHAYAGWKDVPCWYLAATEDQALPVEAQKFFVKMSRDAGGDITLKEIKSGHSPMLSRPEETAEFVREAVDDFVKKGGMVKGE
ncbi:Alpha/beta hydrolase fold-1 [Lasiosphaeris hirsuta]|uniref:Alpha/beta hydrolase fold-1 n=1 Tax=Lasiosphaeris hirsuta TaxID=260670 RepID=A0AA40ARM3_9PEZI|nr:Alpha/beta hydrolase fold-1 [Lasiosphaeris hirsuta]